MKHTIFLDEDIEDCDCYKYIFMSTVVSLGFIHYSDTTFFYLSCTGMTEKETDKQKTLKLDDYITFLEDIIYFFNKPLSQIRVLSIGLTTSLMNLNFLKQNHNEYNKIFNIIIELLESQKKDEAYRLKIELQDEIDCGFIEEEDEDDNIVQRKDKKVHLEEDLFPGYDEIKCVLQWFKTPISNFDEFSLFRKLVEDLKLSNHEAFSELVKSTEDGNTLQNLLKIKRHQVGSREFVRHVVKIKRK